jgi:hypothetical protein
MSAKTKMTNESVLKAFAEWKKEWAADIRIKYPELASGSDERLYEFFDRLAKLREEEQETESDEEDSDSDDEEEEEEEDYCNGCDTDVASSTMFNHDDINLCPKCNENKPELIPAGCGCVLCGDDEDLEPLEFDGEKLLFIGLTSGKVFRQTEDAGDVLIGVAGRGRFKDVKIPTEPVLSNAPALD